MSNDLAELVLLENGFVPDFSTEATVEEVRDFLMNFKKGVVSNGVVYYDGPVEARLTAVHHDEGREMNLPFGVLNNMVISHRQQDIQMGWKGDFDFRTIEDMMNRRDDRIVSYAAADKMDFKVSDGYSCWDLEIKTPDTSGIIPSPKVAIHSYDGAKYVVDLRVDPGDTTAYVCPHYSLVEGITPRDIDVEIVLKAGRLSDFEGNMTYSGNVFMYSGNVGEDNVKASIVSLGENKPYLLLFQPEDRNKVLSSEKLSDMFDYDAVTFSKFDSAFLREKRIANADNVVGYQVQPHSAHLIPEIMGVVVEEIGMMEGIVTSYEPSV